MLAAAVLTLIVIAYRIVLGMMGSAHMDWLHNFSPLAAVALCGAIYFPRKVAIAFPLAALFISDIALNAHYHMPWLNWYMVPQYLALGTICAMGWALRQRPSLLRVLLASVAGSLIYYVVTNTASWWMEPVVGAQTVLVEPYAHTFEGWWQALTVGVPGFPPTLIFFRNSLASDLIFTGLFLGCLAMTRRPMHAAEEPHESLRAQFARRLW